MRPRLISTTSTMIIIMFITMIITTSTTSIMVMINPNILLWHSWGWTSITDLKNIRISPTFITTTTTTATTTILATFQISTEKQLRSGFLGSCLHQNEKPSLPATQFSRHPVPSPLPPTPTPSTKQLASYSHFVSVRSVSGPTSFPPDLICINQSLFPPHPHQFPRCSIFFKRMQIGNSQCAESQRGYKGGRHVPNGQLPPSRRPQPTCLPSRGLKSGYCAKFWAILLLLICEAMKPMDSPNYCWSNRPI